MVGTLFESLATLATNGKRVLRRDKKRLQQRQRRERKSDSEDEPKAKAKAVAKAKAKESESSKEESEGLSMNRRVATWDGRKTLSVIVSTLIISFLLPYGFFVILLTTVLLIQQLLLRLIFTGPEKKPTIQRP